MSEIFRQIMLGDEILLNVTSVSSELFDQERLELIRSQSYSRISSRNPSVRINSDVLRAKYADMTKEELLETLLSTELHSLNMEDENYALVEQVDQCRRDIVCLQADFTKLKVAHSEKVSELIKSRDSFKVLAEKRELEIIFLEDHARFSAEQTRLSISHWDLLLKNRDENIELLSTRISQLANDSRLLEAGVTADKYKCLVERYQSLRAKYKALLEHSESGIGTLIEDFPETDIGEMVCPWRHQADVRVSQLERVTSQLNSTYEQLHAKSDELLIQNRDLGSLRRKVFDYEAKIKKQKLKILKLRNEPRTSPESSQPHSE